MFIYKITNTINGKCYIGLDTHAVHLQKRWKTHKRNCKNADTKFYAVLCNNIDKFTYKILDHASTVIELVHKEIFWINFYDSYRTGYNSTTGGECAGVSATNFTEEDMSVITRLYSVAMTSYNVNKKWKNTTPEQRKEMTAHLLLPEVLQARSDTMSDYWAAVAADVKTARLSGLASFWENLAGDDKENARQINIKNSLKGAAAVSKKVKIQYPDGSIRDFKSKSAFVREYGYIIDYLLVRTLSGGTHHGLKGWIV